jgi:uncharacterized OB-fold protein
VLALAPPGAEGARIVSNLIDIEPCDVSIGMHVEVVWEDMGPQLAVPRFRATTDAKGARG